MKRKATLKLENGKEITILKAIQADDYNGGGVMKQSEYVYLLKDKQKGLAYYVKEMGEVLDSLEYWINKTSEEVKDDN